MLVIARKKQQGFFLDGPGGRVRIVITEIHHHLVRIGIEAPAEIKIIRDDAIIQEAPHAT